MVKKVRAMLDSSKASGSNCIPVVVLKNCELEVSYILSVLFNMCLWESCFPDCWKVSLMLPVFKKLKTVVLLVFFKWLVKSLKNL